MRRISLSGSRPYIQNTRPSAKKFFARPFSLFESSVPSSAAVVRWLMSTAWTLYLSRLPSSSGFVCVAGLLEVRLDERAGVDDQRAAVDEILEVGLERRRVHRDEHVGRVARRVDLRRREVELEARDAEQAAGRSADLGGEVRERRDVVAGLGGGLRELGAGELHAVARVAGEADDDSVQMLRFHRLLPLTARRKRAWRGPYQHDSNDPKVDQADA